MAKRLDSQFANKLRDVANFEMLLRPFRVDFVILFSVYSYPEQNLLCYVHCRLRNQFRAPTATSYPGSPGSGGKSLGTSCTYCIETTRTR